MFPNRSQINKSERASQKMCSGSLEIITFTKCCPLNKSLKNVVIGSSTCQKKYGVKIKNERLNIPVVSANELSDLCLIASPWSFK